MDYLFIEAFYYAFNNICVCVRAFTYNAFIHFMADICIIYFSPLNILLVFNCRVVGTIALKMLRHMVSETS